MIGPIRIRLSRAKGWRMPANTVKVVRPGRWGNPFNLRDSSHCWTALAHGFKGHALGRQMASVFMFEAWVRRGHETTVEGCGLYMGKDAKTGVPIALAPDIVAPAPPSLADIREHLAGKNLACWCALDAPCHADVLLELANRP